MTNQIDQFFNPEKELKAIIAKYHDDTAAIRRHMIEYGILERDSESVYWVVRGFQNNLGITAFEL